MELTRRQVALGSAAIATTAFAVGPEAVAVDRRHPSRGSGRVVLDWQRISMDTLFAPPTAPPGSPTGAGLAPPIGTPVLGFTSLAIHHAVQRSLRQGRSSERAAVAQAAHDVLVHYVRDVHKLPALVGPLDSALQATLSTVRDRQRRRRGRRIGAVAASELIASRAGDHYLDPAITYSKPPGPGVWQPNAGTTNMAAAWLGSLPPLVLGELVTVGGPDGLASSSWAMEYNETKAYGRATGSARSQAMTDTAQFFNSNAATMVSDALVRYLRTHPLKLRRTALLFARVHGAMTDSVIAAWRLKREVGFWRPYEAIAGHPVVGHFDDGNPDTAPDPGWTPLVANPNYSDYISGHASVTSPAVEVIRRTLGEETRLELRSQFTSTPAPPRTYDHLYELEHDALNARIWSGLHFRRAMVDGYEIGHRTAERVMTVLD
jgi:hypothetical protein